MANVQILLLMLCGLTAVTLAHRLPNFFAFRPVDNFNGLLMGSGFATPTPAPAVDSFEEWLDSEEAYEKNNRKREAGGDDMGTDKNLYELILSILDAFQTSVQGDLRRAMDRDLKRRSI